MSTLDTNCPEPHSKLENILSPCLPSLLSTFSSLNHYSFILEPIIELTQDTRISSDTITSCCCRDDYIYIGISSGVIMRYKLNGSKAVLKCSTSIGKHPIDHMEVIYGVDFEILVVLSHNIVTLHNPKSLMYFDTVPVSNVSMFCCNSGYPFCGLAVISGKSLHLFNLHYRFDISKVFEIDDESPYGLCWIKDCICISYKDHYTFLNDVSGRIMKVKEAGTLKPVIKPLPHEEICITENKTISIVDSSLKFGMKINLKYTPTTFAFSFPYIISISEKETMIEIKNLVNPEYSEYIHLPDNLINLKGSSDDSKFVYLVKNKTIYLLKAIPSDKSTNDDMILKSIVIDGNHNLLKKYVQDIILTEDTIYNRLLKDYIKRFKLECKYIKQDNPLEGIKFIVAKYIRKLYILLSINLSKLLLHDEARNKLYLCIYDIFHSSIYDVIMPYMCKTSATLDKSYLEKINLLKPLSPSQFNIGKRFWLNEHSLLDEREIKREISVDNQNNEVQENDNILNNEDLILAGNATLTKTFVDSGEKISELVKVFYDGYGIYLLSSNGSYLTPKPIIDEDNVQYDENESVISWKEKEFNSQLVFESNQDFREFITQFRFYSHENKQSDSDADNYQKDIENYVIENNITSKLKTLTLRFSKRELKTNPLRKSSSFDDGILEFSDNNNGFIDYYKPAYTLLRTLSKKRSPRQKAICLSKVLDKIIECIDKFWNPYNKKFNVIADDLVPILTYIIAKSEIPSINGELNYMIEFSNERSVHGKHSYSLATFQIAVDSLKFIEKEPVENHESLDIYSSGRYKAQILVNKLDNLNEKLHKESNSSGIENKLSKSSSGQSNKESSCTLS